jgi:hypothetical protein
MPAATAPITSPTGAATFHQCRAAFSTKGREIDDLFAEGFPAPEFE